MARRFVLIPVSLLFSCAVLPAQVIIQNFTGVNLNDVNQLNTGGTPPDSDGAAGPNHYVEFINGAFAVYSKGGARLSLISDNAFWENAGISAATISAGLTDTRLIYDPGSSRFFASEITLDFTGAQVLLARSDSSDPTGPWKAVHFDSNTDSLAPDFDTLGVDSTGVYVGVNNFDGFDTFAGVSFFSIPKADLIASTPSLAHMTRFDNLDDTTYGFTLQAASNPDAGTGHGVMVAVDNVDFNFIDRTTISGSGTATATLGTTVRISTAFDAIPDAAHQPSGSFIDTGDDRFSASVRQVGNNIFIANNILQGSRDAVHWMVLNEVDNTLVGEGIISDTTYDYYYPSIAANHNGTFLLVFNRSGTASPAGDVSIYGALGTVSASSASVGPNFVVRAGTVSNFHFLGDTSPYRWGDYSNTMVDPTDENLFWTIQETAPASTTWGTQITLISVATNRPTLKITPTGSSVSLSWPLSTDPAYVLQASPAVAVSSAWTNVPNAATIVINQNVVTVPAPSTPLFFRLKK